MMRRIGFLLIIGLVGSTPGFAASLQDAAAEASKELAKSCIVTGEFHQGQERFTRNGAAGLAKASDERLLFEIGSISKVFTGLLLAIAVEEGKLGYSKTLDDLMDLEFADPKVGRITLLQLATHTSGLPRLPDNHLFDSVSDPYADYDREKLDAYLAKAKLDGNGPYDASYSNLGVGLLGDLLARAYGKTWDQLIQEKIADPLGLTDTCQNLDEEQEKRLVRPRDGSGEGKRWTFTALAGAGALHSSAADLMRFGRAFLRPDETALTKPLKQVITIQSRAHGLGGPIGLGMMIRQLDGQTENSHSGGTGGYRSHLQILPKEGRVRVVLINNSAGAPAAVVMATRDAASPESADSIEISNEELARFPAIYQMGPNSKFTILIRDGKLAGQLTGQAFVGLECVGPMRFRYVGVDAELLFVEKDKQVSGLTLLQNGREVKAERTDGKVPDLQFPEEQVLDTYVGEYRLSPQATFTISRRGDTLFAKLTGQPAFPVFQSADHHFQYLITEAAIEFEHGEDGKVVALVLHQKGEHRAPKM